MTFRFLVRELGFMVVLFLEMGKTGREYGFESIRFKGFFTHANGERYLIATWTCKIYNSKVQRKGNLEVET